ncbi:MAG: AbrB/MazE/SpoVT family DNA-binding domain-containing protein [Verrucomicrobiota bacterium]|nr:AbrB/MazE/SpoVT family DNA-binding domain-containing protein [Verrucomicrobiota bacterium]
MNGTIQKWGNSLALRIPRSIADEIELQQGDSVKMEITSGVLAIRPARPRYQLAELVRGITAENCHKESDWGKAEGSEAW